MVEDFRARRAAQEAQSRKLRVVVSSLFAVVVLVAFLVAAVSNGGLGSDVAEDDGSAATTDAETVQVVDSTGRSVLVPAEPDSIAVFDSFSGELAVLIGAGPKLAGVPNGTKSDTILKTIYPDLENVTSTSGNSINLETQMASGVDVVIVKSTMGDAECKKLETMGIPYVKVGYETVAEQIEAIRLVGSVCGSDAASKAEAIAAYYEQTVDEVGRRVADIPDNQKTSVYHAINDALTTDSKDSLGADWIELSGCVDVSAQEEATSDTDYTATLEQIYVWDPDLIICNVAETASKIRSDAAWSGLGAVEDGSVLNIPIGATRWGQRGSVETWFAMLWLGKQAYPDLFSDVDLEQTVKDAYQQLYGVTVDDALYEQMVSGEGIRTSGNGNGGEM